MAKTATTRRRRTVPVTTMEEVPVLSAKERELRTRLEQAEARIAAGEGVDYDPTTFRKRLTDIYRGAHI